MIFQLLFLFFSLHIQHCGLWDTKQLESKSNVNKMLDLTMKDCDSAVSWPDLYFPAKGILSAAPTQQEYQACTAFSAHPSLSKAVFVCCCEN